MASRRLITCDGIVVGMLLAVVGAAWFAAWFWLLSFHNALATQMLSDGF